MKPARTTLAAALLVVLALSGCGDEGAGRAIPADPGPSTSTPDASAVPDDLTCPTDRRASGRIDYVRAPGFDSPEAAAAQFLREGERLAVDRVDRDRADDWVLRPDGTARTRVTARRGSEGWYADTIESCEGEEPLTTRSTDVLLEIGHCWVEPFMFDGEEWALPTGDQFDWGGRYPDGISGEGTAVRLTAFDDRLSYTDDEGGRLTFRLSSDPRTALPGGGMCD